MCTTFPSAFDIIDHCIPIQCLPIDFGFNDTAPNAFTLSDWKHSAYISGYTSASIALSPYVPYVRALGTMFFTMYFELLSTIIDSHSITQHSFADDL